MSLSKVKVLHTVGSSRVKCLDFHPTQPLLLASLYSGDAIIIDCSIGAIARTFPVHPGTPLRTGRWIPQNGNIVVGGDKYSLHFFSPTKGKQILEVPDVHDGYVRAVAVHPTDLLLLTSGDDQRCKLWDISTACACIRVFEGHTGLVMDVKWNPREPTAFASSSLDGSIVYWDSQTGKPRFTQKIGSKCVNAISFPASGDRSLIATASDTKIAQIWDLQSRTVLASLEGHDHNVTRAEFHPTRPLLLTTSEDNRTFLWSTVTFRCLNKISAGLERGWALAVSNTSALFAAGYDRGLIVGKFVHHGVPISLDGTVKIVTAKGPEISMATIKQVGEIVDGSEISVTWKPPIATETPSIELMYSPNGRFVVSLSDDEWMIYTALGFRPRAFGKGLKFAWSADANSYAVLDLGFTISVFRAFEKQETIQTYARKVWGGELLSASVNGGLEFYDWADCKLVRRIEVKACDVKWCGSLVAIRTKSSIFVLEYQSASAEGEWTAESGYEDAFHVAHEIDVKSTSICWSANVLFFTENIKINRFIAGIVQTTATLKTPTEILGYLPKENLIVLVEPQRKLIGVSFPASLLQFEAEVAAEEDPDPGLVPEQYKSRCAKFLKQLGRTELALGMTTDPAVKFDLALELDRLDIAESAVNDPSMWRRLARAALVKGDFELAVRGVRNCGDLSTLLVLLKARNRVDEMKELVDEAEAAGQLNVAFTAALLVDQKKRCVELLLKSEKWAEAALFARSNAPEMTSQCVRIWREKLPNKQLADALADPAEYPTLFDELIERHD
jgi:coatomer subunit beta'